MLLIDVKRAFPKFMGHTNETHAKYYEMPLRDQHLSIVGPILYKQTASEKLGPNEDEITVEMGSTRNMMNETRTCSHLSISDEDNHISDVGVESTPPRKTKRNNWTTPEKNELMEKLPGTVLGLYRPGKGGIKKFGKILLILKKNIHCSRRESWLANITQRKRKFQRP